ncbi:hypothetical protein Naga_101164g2 [Nannochloropsis gaditana]|uniref:Uncharacterized protein n=1 Tax=Nannochloropsis gaditana TaxID=72520 RepID=W7TUY6_9STRA|nr:hypothetical protein Naga_101164g2 [Nannochloropsis gaditana]
MWRASLNAMRSLSACHILLQEVPSHTLDARTQTSMSSLPGSPKEGREEVANGTRLTSQKAECTGLVDASSRHAITPYVLCSTIMRVSVWSSFPPPFTSSCPPALTLHPPFIPSSPSSFPLSLPPCLPPSLPSPPSMPTSFPPCSFSPLPYLPPPFLPPDRPRPRD